MILEITDVSKKPAQLELYGYWVTDRLLEMIRERTCSQWVDDPNYKLAKKAGVFIQGVDIQEKVGWILLEFWSEPEDYQPFIDMLNRELGIREAKYEIYVSPYAIENSYDLYTMISEDTGVHLNWGRDYFDPVRFEPRTNNEYRKVHDHLVSFNIRKHDQ
jgi:hypothetical protein